MRLKELDDSWRLLKIAQGVSLPNPTLVGKTKWGIVALAKNLGNCNHNVSIYKVGKGTKAKKSLQAFTQYGLAYFGQQLKTKTISYWIKTHLTKCTKHNPNDNNK